MAPRRFFRWLVGACLGALVCLAAFPARAQTPVITSFTLTNGQGTLQFTPHPAAQVYNLLSSTNLGSGFITNAAGTLTGFNYSVPATNNFQFFNLQILPLSSNAQLTATVLSRLTYGPTPDLLERLLQDLGTNSAAAFIDELLNPETIAEDVSNTHTNVPFIEAKFFGATNLITVLITTNTTLPTAGGPGGQLTNIINTATNDGFQIILNSVTNITSTTNANAGSTNITVSSPTSANISDLRAWHVLRAVGARRQLLEILLQFLENHFVTQYSKSSTYLNSFYNGDGNVREDRYATQWEYLENYYWRQALLNPNCNFYDLLKISAESPAMIVYLDTVNSRSDGSRVANENYARELLELFSFGVDNGYDQNDITIMSRSWAGWSVEFVHPTNAFNPFAAASATRIVGAPPTGANKTNLVGVWAFNFKTASANTTNLLGPIFAGKTIPDRFGPPWAGNLYQMNPTSTTVLTNKIRAAYDVLQHIANQPFTMEYISVKLCRLFVNDNFPNPTTKTNLPEYAFYDYTSTNLSPEASLVHQCMLAWDAGGPDGRRGNIRSLLRTIFNSDLFRANASRQKIKTPLEFVVSTLRATRANTNATGVVNATNFTARTDGYALVGSGATTAPSSAPLTRMGNMLLFERDAPDGYPEAAAPWISAGTLAERLRFVQSVMIAAGQTGKSDAGNNNTTDPVGLLRAKLPNTSWTNAPAVADYFIGIIFPSEGAANLNQYRTAAINFLNTTDDGLSSSAFSALTVSAVAGQPYDTRVRGMVSMLLTFQRFQEQ
jgi:uncharacterized protein (DUF1800 family)